LNLPRSHAVRRLLAAASVEGYLKGGKYKFADLAQDYTLYGADLLQEVPLALRKLQRKDVSWGNPSTEKKILRTFKINDRFCEELNVHFGQF